MRCARVYVVRDGRLVDVTDAVRAPPEPRVHILDDRAYVGLSVPGFDYEAHKPKAVDLSTRSRHRRYMLERGLTHASDFDGPGGEWERAAARRERLASGTDPENNRRIEQAVVESVRRLEAGYKPPPPEPVEHDERSIPTVYPPKEQS